MASWFSPTALDFSGESLDLAEDSVSSSPVSSTETEDAAGGSTCCRSRPSVNLLPLDQLGVVGACRRGRRKGQRNRTPAQRVMEAEGKRTEKNVRERMRVEHVRDEYLKLQMLLGFGHSKSVNKLQTLNAAIDYIKELRKVLERLQGETEFHLPTLPRAPSEGHVTQEKQQETPGTLQDSGDKRKGHLFPLQHENNAAGARSFLDIQLADLPDENHFEDVYFDGEGHRFPSPAIAGSSLCAHHSLEHPSLANPSLIAMLPERGAVALAADQLGSHTNPLPEYTLYFDTNMFQANETCAFQTPRHY